MTTSIHIKAIDWALAQGYSISVSDYCEDEYDVLLCRDRVEILGAVEGTELPNVFIHKPSVKSPGKWVRVAVFSVIDEGIPDETINDYVAQPDGEFDKAWHDGFAIDEGVGWHPKAPGVDHE